MILQLIIIFIVFSVLGWLFEYIVFNKNHDAIPFLPIYGFGAVIIYLISKIFHDYSIWVKTFVAFILINSMECIGGCLSYQLYGYKTWNYDNTNDIVFCNGYISLRTGICWALISFIAFAAIDKFNIQ